MRKLIIGKTQRRCNFQVQLVKQKSVKIQHKMPDKERKKIIEIYIITFKEQIRIHLQYKRWREIKVKKEIPSVSA